MPLSEIPIPTISYIRYLYVDDYLYVSGPTGTATYPSAAEDLHVATWWPRWTPFTRELS